MHSKKLSVDFVLTIIHEQEQCNPKN